ncbi:MAG TPA: ABC transporter substrate-binding protein, partial [Pseudonocardiaceae bacterium]|nr:ABC transporter substrate-binding protein [Pseudonocardiaceae bacterium]
MTQPTSPQMLRRIPAWLWGGKPLRAVAAAISVALVSASLTACAGSSGTGTSTAGQATGGPIKIGIVTSLTGPYSVLGQADIQGLDIAVSQINAKGGIRGRKIQIVTQDDQTSASQAVVALNSL